EGLDVEHVDPVPVRRCRQRERKPDGRLPGPEAPHDKPGLRLQRGVEAMARIDGVEDVLVIAVESSKGLHQPADVATVARPFLLRRVRVDADPHRDAAAPASRALASAAPASRKMMSITSTSTFNGRK